MTLQEIFVGPFQEFAFMRRALVACIVLSASGVPLGFFMNQRRMALVSDAMSHAILPGVAVAFLIAGSGVWSLTLGGIIAGVLIALFSLFLTQTTQIKEDAVFTLLFLLSLTLGIVLLSIKGSNIDLLHMLLGDILALSDDALIFMTVVASLTLFALAFIYRGLVLDCFDPDFLAASGFGRSVRVVFFVLFIVNLVAAFQALGTLMALGLILLPSIASGFWCHAVASSILLGGVLALAASFAGLLVSFYTNTPSGPMVVLFCAAACLFSAFFGTRGGFFACRK